MFLGFMWYRYQRCGVCLTKWGPKLSVLLRWGCYSDGLNKLSFWYLNVFLIKSILLGYDVTSMSKRIRTFRSSWTSRRLKLTSLRCLEASGSDHSWMQRHIPEKRSFQEHRCTTLKTLQLVLCPLDRNTSWNKICTSRWRRQYFVSTSSDV